MLIRRRELLSLRPSKSENLPTIEDASYLEDIDTLKKWHELLEEGISEGIIVELPYYQLDALTIGALKACISDPAFREKEFKAPDFIDSLWKAIATPAWRLLLSSEGKNLLKEEAKKE